jgi:hypothetical protein
VRAADAYAGSLLTCRDRARSGLVLLFLTVSSPLEFLTGRRSSRPADAGRGAPAGEERPSASPTAAGHRPAPDRLSHAAAHALGLQYRPPRLPQRSAAQHRWAESHAGNAAAAADAAEAAAARAAAAAAAAADAAARARAAAVRTATSDTPGDVAASSTAAAAAAAHASRHVSAAEYAAALAIVAAGPGADPVPDVVYGNRPASPGAQAAAAARGAAPPSHASSAGASHAPAPQHALHAVDALAGRPTAAAVAAPT